MTALRGTTISAVMFLAITGLPIYASLSQNHNFLFRENIMYQVLSILAALALILSVKNGVWRSLRKPGDGHQGHPLDVHEGQIGGSKSPASSVAELSGSKEYESWGSE